MTVSQPAVAELQALPCFRFLIPPCVIPMS